MSTFSDRIANLPPEKQALLFKQLQSHKQSRKQSREQSRNGKQQTISCRPHLDDYPLSFAQRRLWFLDQLEPDSPLYNIPGALQLSGSLDVDVLQQSINHLVQRHEALRANFMEVGGEPVQFINRDVFLEIPVIDLQSVAPSEQTAEIRRLATEEAKRPFNLTHDPLLRATLLKCRTNKHVLLLTVHHIAFDGWSTGIFIEEIGILYHALLTGKTPFLPHLPIQYADFAHWQQEWLQSGILARQRDYWTQQLGSRPPVLELPTDYPRPPMLTHQGAHYRVDLPSHLVWALKDLAQETETTLFMVLLAAFNILLSRYSHQEDICVGVPTANRNRSELEKLIGFFVNTLVMRTDLSAAPTFLELLERVRATTLAAQSNQDIPFEMLVEHLQPNRDMSHMPLFQVMFELQETPLDGLHLGGLQIDLLPVETGTAKFDLSLTMTNTETGLTAEFEYNTTLFAPETICRMAGHFQVLLAAIAADPEQSITTLPLLTAAEQRQLLVEWNDTAVPYPHDRCLHHLFHEQAAKTPNATAVVAENGRLTYAELDQKANQLAHYLQKQGVTRNTIVGLLMDRSVEMIIGLIGILKAGAAYLPIDPDYPTGRITTMIADAQPKVILTQSSINKKQKTKNSQQKTADNQQLTINNSNHSPFTIHPSVDSGQANSQFIILDADWPLIAQEPATTPTTNTEPEDMAYLIYTSGSTGKPKGVMVPHRAALNLLTGLERIIYDTLAQRPLRLSLNATICFDASVQQVVMLLRGHALHIIPQEIRGDGPALLHYIQKHRLHVLDCVPTQLRLLLEAGLLTTNGWTPAAVLPGGEAIDQETWQMLAKTEHIRFFNMYGPTECAVDSTICPVHEYPQQPTIGRPIINAHTYILDQHQQPVPIGVSGELHLGGAGVGLGYLHRPQLTAEKFIPLSVIGNQLSVNGDQFTDHRSPITVYRTGDLCRYLPNGTIEFLGRIDHQVKIRGFRIELGEIEAAIRQHTVVEDVIVLAQGTKEDPHDRRLIAYLIPNPTVTFDPSQLRQNLKSQLPDYMVPSFFIPMAEFPLTPNRKIDRRRLPQPDDIRAALGTTFVSPRNPTEDLLAGLWAQLLGVEQVGIHDNFFELGGHSLIATQLVSRIRSQFDVNLPLRQFFNAPTIAELAAILSAQTTTETAPIPPLPPGEKRPLSFAQQRLWFLDHLEAGSALYNIADAVRIKGKLDRDALTASLNEIVCRHETLRTAFATDENGEPVLHIAGGPTLSVPYEDIRHLPAPEQTELIQQTAVSAASYSFNLNTPPLLRMRLLQTASDEHVALITMHHIISDGWSSGVFIRELAACYAQQSGQSGPALPDLTIQYGDFAHWQRTQLQGAVLDEQLAYWKDQLAGSPQLLELPTDRPRPPVQTFQGEKRPFTLPADLTQQLIQLSRQEGVTLFMTLLATFQTLLHRYTGADFINVGSPIANRTRSELENLIGFFVNTLVLNADFSREPTFRELLQKTRRTTLDAYAHQDVPFEMVVDAVQPERNLSHSPLFQVMFVFQNTPFRPDLLPDLSIEPMDIDGGIAKFDLTLVLKEEADGLCGSFEFNTALFNRDSIDRMIGHFKQLLRSAAADPNQPVATLPLLPPAELQKIVGAWNDTAVPHPIDLPIHHLFAAQVERTPDQIALFYEGNTLTYAALNRKANQLAHYLIRQGVGPNDIVGISMERSLDMIIAMIGIHKAGAAYLPLDPTHPAERIQFMIEDARPKIILTKSTKNRQQLTINNQQLTINQSDNSQFTLRQTQGRLIHPSADSGQANSQFIILDSLWPTIAQSPISNPQISQSPDSLAYVIYTSGSTGKPKGVLLHHRGLCNTAQAYITRLHLGPGSRLLQFFSYGFDGSVGDIFPSLISGTTIYLPPQEILLSPPDLHHYLQANKITHILMTPSMLRVLPTHDLPHLQFVLGGGEQFTRDIAERWMPGRTVVNGYGPTEVTVVSLFHIMDDLTTLPETAVSIPIGHPSDNTQLYILDRHQQPVPIGVPGELYIGGVGVAHGYLNHPELTAEKFVNFPNYELGIRNYEKESDFIIPNSSSIIYKTGDLVRWLPDGTVEFLGRIDHQVKIRGFRIELGEIEAVLEQHDELETAVVTVHEQEGNQRLVAYVIPQQETPPTAQTLHHFLNDRLPAYMVPSIFIPLDELPRLPNGKVNRQALPAPSGNYDEIGGEYTPPDTQAEEILCDIWSQLLHVEKVGIHDNFFALGGDSILTIQVVSRARQAGYHLTPRQIFQFPTIAQLANEVEAAPIIAAEQGIVTGEVPFTPVQHWFFEQAFAEPHHWNQSLMLVATEKLDLHLLETAVFHLLQHHDALRLRFTQTETGRHQTNAGSEPATVVQCVDLSHLPPPTQKVMLTAEANRLQAGLDLETGPLVRLLYFRMGPDTPDQMLIVIHHLAVDGISWRILLEDLQLAYQQLSQEKSIQLPAKTTSYRQWANKLVAYAQSDAVLKEVSYWASLDHDKWSVPIPHDFYTESDTNLVQDARNVIVSLTPAETEALLRNVPPVYGTEMNDILLTALVETFRSYTGRRDLWIELEGHGREDILSGIDLSRTVGWFTSIFPVHLNLQQANTPGDAIKLVKEQLHRIPHHGIGYGILRYLCQDTAIQHQMRALPHPDVSFNYLGQFDQTMTDLQFAPSYESSGYASSPRSQRPHLLAINGGISGGKLQFEWTYCRQIHKESTIQELGHRFVETLRNLITHCQNPEAGGYTPSDFPDVDLSEDDLEALLLEVGD